eukprot:m.40517 g.40517  ORF g.40517 m.40517 type:complete len:179 (-) comp18516_c0_seq3:643-1179(-)
MIQQDDPLVFTTYKDQWTAAATDLSTLVTKAVTFLEKNYVSELPNLKSDGPSSFFVAASSPPITVQMYLQRIVHYGKPGVEAVILMLVYLDKLVNEAHIQITPLSVHRFIAAGMVIASKLTLEKHISNIHFAKLAGISVQDLNRLEMELLECLQFNLFVSTETLSVTLCKVFAEPTAP